MKVNKHIESLRHKIALWLFNTKTTKSATAMMMERHRTLRCDHCGLSPFHTIDNCECEETHDTK